METGAAIHLLQFSLEEQLYALELADIERVVQAVELRVLPGAPPVIRGIFSLHGKIVPVADPRRRIGLPDKEIALDDCIIVTRTKHRALGLLAHGDIDVASCDAREIVDALSVVAVADLVRGIGRLPDGLVLIQNLARFLSLEEESQLAVALDASR